MPTPFRASKDSGELLQGFTVEARQSSLPNFPGILAEDVNDYSATSKSKETATEYAARRLESIAKLEKEKVLARTQSTYS